MLQKVSESSGNTLGFRASGKITRNDYEELTREVQVLIDQEGSINLLLDLEDFKTEAPDAWRADLKFGRKYHQKIARMAIVGDKSWQHLVAKLADPFYAQEAKFFHTSELPAAWSWLRAE